MVGGDVFVVALILIVTVGFVYFSFVMPALAKKREAKNEK